MSATAHADTPTSPPLVPEAVLVQAREAVHLYFTRCFWFRHPEATVQNRDDVRIVIEHLREYGDHRAWRIAQNLRKCL